MNISKSRYQPKRLLALAILPLTISACDSNDTPLLDLEELFPEELITNISTNGDVDTGSGQDPAQEAAPLPTESLSQSDISIEISPELELLTRGELVFESRFGGTGDPIQNVFEFSVSDLGQLSPEDDSEALIVSTDDTLSICAYIPASVQYLCMRIFDFELNQRVFHLFNLQTDTTGAGIFEFCDQNDSPEACTDKLFNDPDGTDIVTITPSNEFALLPNASPYFAYGEQGTVSRRTHTIALSEDLEQIMKAMTTAAENSNN